MAGSRSKEELEKRKELVGKYLKEGLTGYQVRARFTRQGEAPPSQEYMTKIRRELGLGSPRKTTKWHVHPPHREVSVPEGNGTGMHTISAVMSGTVVVQMPDDLRTHLVEWMEANGVESFRRTGEGKLALTIRKEVIL